jgi:hypothetical protein
VSFICWNLSYLGLLGEASAYLRPALKEAGERGDRLLISQLLSGMNVLIPLSQSEDPEQVRDDLVRKVRPWQGESYNMPHMLLTMALCHIDMFVGRGVDAYARIMRDLPHIKGSLLPRVQLLNTDIQGFRARCALAAAPATSDPDRLLAAARHAAAALDRIGAPMATAYATTTRAQLAIAAGAYDSAITMLTAAIGQFHALDMRMHAAACGYRLSGLIDGPVGVAKRAASISTMHTLGIKDPAAMTRVWLPVSQQW